jgi:pimeloyl-ACP methyl ester carboxylesterase
VGLLAAGGAPVLVVFGSRDSFTASRRLRLWAEKLASASEAGSSVVWEQIEGVGHFWREVGARRALDAVLGRWIEKTSRLG